MSSFFCCKDCEERYVGCHSTCEKYLQEKEKYGEHRDKIRKNRSAEADIKGAITSGVRRMQGKRAIY